MDTEERKYFEVIFEVAGTVTLDEAKMKLEKYLKLARAIASYAEWAGPAPAHIRVKECNGLTQEDIEDHLNMLKNILTKAAKK